MMKIKMMVIDHNPRREHHRRLSLSLHLYAPARLFARDICYIHFIKRVYHGPKCHSIW